MIVLWRKLYESVNPALLRDLSNTDSGVMLLVINREGEGERNGGGKN